MRAPSDSRSVLATPIARWHSAPSTTTAAGPEPNVSYAMRVPSAEVTYAVVLGVAVMASSSGRWYLGVERRHDTSTSGRLVAHRVSRRDFVPPQPAIGA